MNYYTDMVMGMWTGMCGEAELDLSEFWEDMASKNGSLISPATFMKPQYAKAARFA